MKGNIAAGDGGGILNSGNFAVLNACDTWAGAISPNTPDSAPTPTPIPC